MLDEGSGVLIKRGTGRRAVAALQAEAEILRFAAHPGVVQLLSSGPGDDEDWELRLRRVDGADLTGAGPWSSAEVAGFGAAAATTLADLHDLGVVHGRLGPDHLLTDEIGRPMICGFSQARRCAGDPAVGERKEADVADLARCLAARLPADPPRALALALARAHSSGRRRPVSARQLARLLGSATVGATLPGAAAHGAAVTATPTSPPVTEATPEQSRDRRRRLAGLAAHGGILRRAAIGVSVLAAVSVVAVLFLAPRGRPGPTSARNHRATAAATRCPAVDEGCGPLTEPGGVLALARGRYRIGRPGDVVVLGRWRCTSTAFVALLQPATGRVWAFGQWARPGRRTTATLLATVRGARSLRVSPGAGGCDRVQVVKASGAPLVLRWWPSPPADVEGANQ